MDPVSNGWDFDAAVVGGGPGGSSAATTLARHGRRVVLLERERFPRFHIGESQLPWSNELFRALGAYETITAGGFVEKWGATFQTPDGGAEQYADFGAAVETPTPQTFQVLRQTFDDVLLRHSARCGVTVLEGHRLLDAAFDPEGVTLRFADAGGVERRARVGVVVDASGRAGVVVKRFGRHVFDPLLQNIVVHAQYEGVTRAEGRRAGDIRMLTRPDMGWLWMIPLSNTVMSVGAVILRSVHRRDAKRSVLRAGLRSARVPSDPTGVTLVTSPAAGRQGGRTRPATARTWRGAASQIATADSALPAMATHQAMV